MLFWTAIIFKIQNISWNLLKKSLGKRQPSNWSDRGLNPAHCYVVLNFNYLQDANHFLKFVEETPRKASTCKLIRTRIEPGTLHCCFEPQLSPRYKTSPEICWRNPWESVNLQIGQIGDNWKVVLNRNYFQHTKKFLKNLLKKSLEKTSNFKLIRTVVEPGYTAMLFWTLTISRIQNNKFSLLLEI